MKRIFGICIVCDEKKLEYDKDVNAYYCRNCEIALKAWQIRILQKYKIYV